MYFPASDTSLSAMYEGKIMTEQFVNPNKATKMFPLHTLFRKYCLEIYTDYIDSELCAIQ